MRLKKCIAILLLFSIFFLSGCSGENNVSINGKIITELNYLSSELIEMINSLNNISYENFRVKVGEIEDSSEEKSSSNGSKEKSNSENSGDESGKQQGEGESSEQSNSEEQKAKTNSDGKSNQGEGGKKDKQMEMVKDGFLISGGEAEWDLTKSKVEILIDAWSQMAMDFREIGVDEKDISDVEKEFNKLIVNVKNEDKVGVAGSIAKIYQYIPRVLEQFTEEKLNLNYEKIKAKVVEAYAALENDDWSRVKQKISDTKGIIEEAKKNANENNDRVNTTKKIESLLEELKNSLGEENKDIFFVRYKNLMREFE